MKKTFLAVAGFVFVLFVVHQNFIPIVLADGPFQMSVGGSAAGAVGEGTQFTASVTDTGGAVSNVIVDIEVHDAAGNKVHQGFFSGQNFGAGQTQTYTTDWTPAGSGTYTVDVGVFAANWLPLISWQEAGLTVNVGSGSGSSGASSGSGFSGWANASPSNPLVGQPVNLTANVKNGADASVGNSIVDVEIYDASHAKVFQQFFPEQYFGGNETKSYTATWTPDAPGTYTADIGVFSADWAGTLGWAENAATILATGNQIPASVAPTPNVNAAASVSAAANTTSVSAASGQFAATGSVSPASPSTGTPVDLHAVVDNTGAPVSSAIVDMEVRDASGARVFQKFFTGQNFSSGGLQSYDASWTPNAASTYTFNVGVFAANWSKLLSWNTVATISTVAGMNKVALAASTPTINAALISAQGSLYIDPNSLVASAVSSIQSSDPSGAALLSIIADEPQGTWFGGWNANVEQDVNTLVTAASNAGQVPLLVAYNIPDRDCGGYSAGGAQTADAYMAWMRQFAAGIGNRNAIVVLEPDGLANIDCLSAAAQATRESLLSSSVTLLKALGNTKVYLDAGNSNWVSASDMAPRLKAAGIAKADGFSLNVSNFYSTDQNVSYGDSLSSLVNGKHFVIDTGRNGNGSDNGAWCNPPGMALGQLPTMSTGQPLVDAYLWIKPPGESDGSCNGGPAAGTFWPQYAEGLATAAGF